MDQAFSRGYNDALAGCESANPYVEGRITHRLYDEGYEKGKEDLAKLPKGDAVPVEGEEGVTDALLRLHGACPRGGCI